MTKSYQADILELLRVFQQALDVQLPSYKTLANSETLYLNILEKILPQYDEFYQQIQRDEGVPFQQKMAAIIKFLEEDIVNQEVGINANEIGNYEQILKILKLLFDITNSLFQEEDEEEKSQLERQQEEDSGLGTQQMKKLQKQSSGSSNRVSDLESFRPKSSNPYNASKNQYVLEHQKQQKKNQKIDFPKTIKKHSNDRKKQAEKIIKQINKKSQNIKQQLAKPSQSKNQNKAKQRMNSKNKVNRHTTIQERLQDQQNRCKQKNNLRLKRYSAVVSNNLKNQLQQQRQNYMYALKKQKLQYIIRMHDFIMRNQKNRLIEGKKIFIKQKEIQTQLTNQRLDLISSKFQDQVQSLQKEKTKNKLTQKKHKLQKQELLQSIQKQLMVNKRKELKRLRREWERQKHILNRMMEEDRALLMGVPLRKLH